MEPGGNDNLGSLRDDLAKGLADIEEREAAAAVVDNDTGQVVDEGGAAAPSSDEGGVPVREDGRDDRGRFVAKSKPDGQAEAGATEQPSDKPAGEGQVEPAADPTAAPPKSWRADEAAEWATMGPKARAAAHRREAEAARLAGANDQERQFGREFAEIVRPHMEDFKRFNVTPQFAFQVLLSNDRVMRHGTPEQKVALARQMLQDYGLDPYLLTQPDPNAPSDPYVLQLQRQVNDLQARLSAPQGQQPTQFAPLPQSQEEASILAEIEAFRTDPAHPHFDAVAQRMMRLLDTEAASDLDEAYQMAVAANPALRSTVPAQAAPDPQRSQADKTAAARRASLQVSGSPGPSADPRPASLRDELRENLRSFGFISG